MSHPNMISETPKSKPRRDWASLTKIYLLLTSGFLSILVWTTPTHAVVLDLSWVGFNGYTMAGTFSYNDALIGTGLINETQVDTLILDFSRYGSPIGAWDLADGLGPGAFDFIFNFDTNTNTFLTTDLGPGADQSWNFFAFPGVGFGSGVSQGLSENFVFLGEIPATQSTLAVGTLGQRPESAFNISWTGSDGYSMTGMFSYWDVFGGGDIDERHLKFLMLEFFLNGSPIGAWDLADGLGPGAFDFIFNFDTNTNTFLTTDLGPGADQSWNFFAFPGVGFGSGVSQGLSENFVFLGEIPATQSTLVATAKPGGPTPVPEPATVLLMGLGLAGLGFARRRRLGA